MAQLQPVKEIRILRYSDLTARGYGSRTTIWRNVRSSKLPPPRLIGNRPGWLEHEIDQTAQQAPIYQPKSSGSEVHDGM